MRSIVKAVNLNKYYDQYHALQDINLEVEQGEVLCIIGPSGSGKSTLLRCLNGLEEFDSGSVSIDGELVGYRVVGNKLHEMNESQIDLDIDVTQRVILVVILVQVDGLDDASHGANLLNPNLRTLAGAAGKTTLKAALTK